MKNRTSILTFGALHLTFVFFIGDARCESLHDLMDTCRQTYRSVAACNAVMKRTVHVQCPIFPEWTELETAELKLLRDGQRFHLHELLRGRTYGNGRFKTFESNTEFLHDGTCKLDVAWSRQAESDISLEQLREMPAPLGVNGSLKPPASGDLEHMPEELSRLGGGSLVFGTLVGAGSLWLPDLIEQLSHPKITVDSSNSLVTITGETEIGNIAVVLDQNAGNLPVSVTIEHCSNHYLGDKKISDYPELNYGSYWPSGFLEKYVDSYRDIEIVNDTVRPYIRKMTQERTYAFRDGVSLQMRDQVEVESMDWPEKFEDACFTIATQIPDGTSVLVEEAPYMAYEIQQGQITPSFDAAAVTAFKEGRLTVSPGRITILMLNAALMILIVGVVVLRRRSTNS